MKRVKLLVLRVIALIIDLVVSLVIIPELGRELVNDRFSFLVFTFIASLAYWSFEIVSAKSLGKRLMGLKIVDYRTGSKPDVVFLLARFLVKHLFWIFPTVAEIFTTQVALLPGMISLAGYTLILFFNGRALHDLAGKTEVRAA